MDAQTLFIKANQALKNVVVQIKDDQLQQTVPAEMTWKSNQALRDYMNMLAYENKCVPGVLAGDPKQPTNQEFKDDLLGNDPQANYVKYSDAADQATKDPDDPERTVHISYGDFPAQQYLRDVTLQRTLSAYDIAKFISVDTKLPEDVVQGLWDTIGPVAEDLRNMGVFGPKVDVPEDRPLQDRFMGLTGRNPEL